MQSKKLNDLMLLHNKAICRSKGDERLAMHRLQKNMIQEHRGDSESNHSEDSIDKVLSKLNRIPVDSHSIAMLRAVENKLKNKERPFSGRNSEKKINEVGQIFSHYIPVVSQQKQVSPIRNDRRASSLPKSTTSTRLSASSSHMDTRFTTNGHFKLRNKKHRP